MTIAIDFDGVIHKYSKGWLDGSIYDVPMDGAKETIDNLINEGHTVIVSTARPNIEDIKPWLIKNGFPDIEVTNRKPPAKIYIDDRAIRFTSWNDIKKYIL